MGLENQFLVFFLRWPFKTAGPFPAILGKGPWLELGKNTLHFGNFFENTDDILVLIAHNENIPVCRNTIKVEVREPLREQFCGYFSIELALW